VPSRADAHYTYGVSERKRLGRDLGDAPNCRQSQLATFDQPPCSKWHLLVDQLELAIDEIQRFLLCVELLKADSAVFVVVMREEQEKLFYFSRLSVAS
jgi:hypothetical protein